MVFDYFFGFEPGQGTSQEITRSNTKRREKFIRTRSCAEQSQFFDVGDCDALRLRIAQPDGRTAAASKTFMMSPMMKGLIPKVNAAEGGVRKTRSQQ